ncbi:MAG: hypothetical protein IPH07_24795 [Deltaproteobacteria bacterium]|nr:hypothetical protein [Deltaproteobacteria bacterium]
MPVASATSGRVSAWWIGAVWAGGPRPLDQHVDRQPDLGVHRDERAQLAGAQERAEDLLVVARLHAGGRP